MHAHAELPFFPVTYSTLSTATLMAEVLPEYAIGTPSSCQLLGHGLNDTYLVHTEAERFILRVYRAGWRSTEDIGYELDVLNHLDRRGIKVAAPIARNDGRFLRFVNAPEGPRAIVLFRYAPGREPTHEGEQSYQYGRAVAALHAATDDFISSHTRFQLDLDHMIDRPLAAIRPFLAHRPDDWGYLQRTAQMVRARIECLPAEKLERGFCHGDFHGGNAHIDEHEALTFFDFDCGGPGWRAYDLATFRQGPWGKTSEHWDAFLKGYQEMRTLPAIDFETIPAFVAARHIWLMGLHCANSYDWGCGWINDEYFDGGGAGGLVFLREWVDQHLSDTGDKE